MSSVNKKRFPNELHDLFEPLSGNVQKDVKRTPDTSKPRAEPPNEYDLLK